MLSYVRKIAVLWAICIRCGHLVYINANVLPLSSYHIRKLYNVHFCCSVNGGFVVRCHSFKFMFIFGNATVCYHVDGVLSQITFRT